MLHQPIFLGWCGQYLLWFYAWGNFLQVLLSPHSMINASCRPFFPEGPWVFLTASIEHLNVQLNKQIKQYSVQATEIISCPPNPFHPLSYCSKSYLICSLPHSSQYFALLWVIYPIVALGTIPLAIFFCDSPIFAVRVQLEGLHTSLNDRVPEHAFLVPLHVMGTAQTCQDFVTVETVNCTNKENILHLQ